MYDHLGFLHIHLKRNDHKIFILKYQFFSLKIEDFKRLYNRRANGCFSTITHKHTHTHMHMCNNCLLNMDKGNKGIFYTHNCHYNSDCTTRQTAHNILCLSGDSVPIYLDLFLYKEQMEIKMKYLSKIDSFLRILQTTVQSYLLFQLL